MPPAFVSTASALAQLRRFYNISKIDQLVQRRDGDAYVPIRPGQYVEGARFAFLVGTGVGFWRETTNQISVEQFTQLASQERDPELLRRLRAVEARKYSMNREPIITLLTARIMKLSGVEPAAADTQTQGQQVTIPTAPQTLPANTPNINKGGGPPPDLNPGGGPKTPATGGNTNGPGGGNSGG